MPNAVALKPFLLRSGAGDPLGVLRGYSPWPPQPAVENSGASARCFGCNAATLKVATRLSRLRMPPRGRVLPAASLGAPPAAGNRASPD